jgi:CelD/BcsL family acetyltransferase involved in cellulose biosynthesis
MLSYEIICGGAEAIPLIAGQWTALCNEGACADPFLRPEWFTALAGTFGIDVKLLTVRRDGELRAVLPLANGRSSVHGIPVNSIRSAYNLNTPRFGLIHGNDREEREAVTEEMWRALGRSMNWSMFEARMTGKNDWLAGITESARRAGQLTGEWEMDAAPYISLKDTQGNALSIDSFFSGPRRHFGRELARRFRRLRELGPVHFDVQYVYSFDAVQKYLDLETRGWKARKGTAAVQDPRSASLHHEFARLMGSAGKLRIYELNVDGRAIAMSLNIVDGARIFHWKTTFDEAFSKFSPGNLLFRRLVEDSIAEGLDEIDLMSPSTANKRAWATGEREHAAFYIIRPNALGKMLWTWKFGVIKGFRGLKRSLPQRFRGAH